jgi:hypothetical protein
MTLRTMTTGRMSWQFAADAHGCGAVRTTGRKAFLKERSHG